MNLRVNVLSVLYTMGTCFHSPLKTTQNVTGEKARIELNVTARNYDLYKLSSCTSFSLVAQG